jgi:hypothetical protein
MFNIFKDIKKYICGPVPCCYIFFAFFAGFINVQVCVCGVSEPPPHIHLLALLPTHQAIVMRISALLQLEENLELIITDFTLLQV